MPVPGIVAGLAGGTWQLGRGVATSPMVRGAFGSAWRSAGKYMGSSMHARGARWAAEGYGLGKGMGMFGRALGLGFLGLEAYSGYQREGAWGAAKGVASGAAMSYAMGAVLGSAALPVALGVGAIGGGIMLNKFAAGKGRSTMLGHKRTEFGAGVSDQYGTVATMRRRSIMALNESRISGGMGIGNEAMRQYQPYFR